MILCNIYIIKCITFMYRGGIDFLGQQSGLRVGCFVAMEAVRWVMDNVHEVGSRREAIKVLQVRYIACVRGRVEIRSSDVNTIFV